MSQSVTQGLRVTVKTLDNASKLIRIFNAEFGAAHSVRLVGGALEPLYLPRDEQRPIAEIHFREDFAASALHELAHWCLAGKQRREQEDYGYWYDAMRDASQQQKFEAVEVRPQSIEWILSVAAGLRFRISSDNFQVEKLDVDPFRRAVRATVLSELKDGLPSRVNQLAVALALDMPEGNERFADPGHYQELPVK